MNKQKILELIFDETTNGQGLNRRYVARSYTGGTGWGVYDIVLGKFLSNELSELTESNFRDLVEEV